MITHKSELVIVVVIIDYLSICGDYTTVISSNAIHIVNIEF